MSNAASTIPAKSKVFRAKFNKIPSLEDNKLKTQPKSKRKPIPKDVDVLVIKHKHEENNTSHDKHESNNFEDEKTWMEKSKDLESGKVKKNQIALSNLRQKNVKKQTLENGAESNKPTIKIMNVQQYEGFMDERAHLLELNEKYEKRIAELEQEVERVLGEFTKLYEDNERLRRKMDTGNDPLLEPYSRVFEDRRILREAEGGYKKRIIRLEKEIIEKQNESDKFQDKLKALQEKFKPTSQAEEKDRITKEKRSKAELKKLRTENESLKHTLREFENSNEREAVKKVQAENDTLKKVIKKLEHQIARKNVKSMGLTKDFKSIPKGNKQQHVNFEERPVKFDYEYLLPDSQVYD
ncbi:DNA ligase 1-like [Ruditapes philippinarum]|uniref:DNA ligase 1-like n=1 Tax=Ruditapes philippinarum TaxID=129788 RepID=UPI00295AFB93|nr:DNA ligase 1-like [Ruditapes philippinarum]